jgi:hypothetical protein
MEQTKNALKTVLGIFENALKADADGKITTIESIGIGISAISLIGVFKHLPDIEAELKAITPAGIDEIIAEFKADFAIDDKDLQAKIFQGADIFGELLKAVLAQV